MLFFNLQKRILLFYTEYGFEERCCSSYHVSGLAFSGFFESHYVVTVEQ